MNIPRGCVIGCAVAAVVGLLAAGGVALFFMHVAKDPEGLTVWVAGPDEVKVGDTFDLQVRVGNQRKNKVIRMSSIDIAEDYLKGFILVASDPPAKSSEHVPIDDSRSFTFDARVPAGQTNVFTFKLKAVRSGFYRGDVDVCEGMRFITGMAQTSVK